MTVAHSRVAGVELEKRGRSRDGFGGRADMTEGYGGEGKRNRRLKDDFRLGLSSLLYGWYGHS